MSGSVGTTQSWSLPITATSSSNIGRALAPTQPARACIYFQTQLVQVCQVYTSSKTMYCFNLNILTYFLTYALQRKSSLHIGLWDPQSEFSCSFERNSGGIAGSKAEWRKRLGLEAGGHPSGDIAVAEFCWTLKGAATW